MTIRFEAIPTLAAEALWAGGTDSYGRVPEEHLSYGEGTPCRHCLTHVGKGEPYLILAYRPFPELQPYAETGPIFIHARPCERHTPCKALPPILRDSPDYIVRGYGADNRIVYGTGAVTPTDGIPARAADLLGRQDIAYLHVRSARNNCYQCRIDRAP